MVIGLLIMEILIPDANSLKQRRMVVNSIKERIHNKFNASVAESRDDSSRNKCSLAVVHISNENAFTNSVLSKVVNFVEQQRKAILEDYSLTFL